MKIYNEQIALQSQKQREVFNITTRVKAAAEKSGVRDAIAVVSSLHSDTAVIVSADEPGLLEDLGDWLAETSSSQNAYKHQGRFERAANIHFQSLLLHHQVLVPITEGKASRFLCGTGRPPAASDRSEDHRRIESRPLTLWCGAKI